MDVVDSIRLSVLSFNSHYIFGPLATRICTYSFTRGGLACSTRELAIKGMCSSLGCGTLESEGYIGPEP